MSDFTSESSVAGGDPAAGPAHSNSKSESEIEPLLTAADIVQRIHSGQLAADSITLQQRQQCVSYLSLEGFTVGEIASLLHVSERTVKRDRQAVRQAEALTPGLSLGDELLGEYQRQTLSSIQRLTRMINDKSNPAFARLWAEEAINRIYQRFVDCVHRLGYLDDGQARLKYLRQTDPAAKECDRQDFTTLMTNLPNLMASLSGGK